MSGKDNAKAELIAIYRLEFYRKQSNWKLFNDRKKNKKKARAAEPPPPAADSPPPADTRPSLNETYNVSFPKTDAASSLHNNAFLESDSNIAQALEQEPETKTTTESQQQLPNNITDVNKDKEIVVKKKRSRIWNIPWSELQDAWTEELRFSEGGHAGDGWPAAGDVGRDTAGQTDNISTIVQCGVSRDLVDGVEGGGPQFEARSGTDRPWTVAEQLTWIDDWSSFEDQFMLEAHLGPHSTAMSQSGHETAADALRELLLYAERHVEVPSYNSTREEFPTHDDPIYFTRTSRKIPDVILSGSHNNYVHFNLDAERLGHIDRNVGHIDRNVGHIDQNIEQYDKNDSQCNNNATQYAKNVSQCIDNAGQYAKNIGQCIDNAGQYVKDVGQCIDNAGQYVKNVGQCIDNAGQYGKNVGQCIDNAGQYAKNVSQYSDNIGQYAKNVGCKDNAGQYAKNVEQCIENATQYGKSVGQCNDNAGQYIKKFGQFIDNVGQYSNNVGQYNDNAGRYDKNIGQYDKNVGQYNRNVEQYINNINQNSSRNNQYASNVDQCYKNIGQYDQNFGRYKTGNGPYDKNMNQYNKVEFNRNVGHPCQYYDSKSDNHNDLKDNQYKDIDPNNNNSLWEGRGRGRGRNCQQGIVIGQGRPYRV